MTLAPARRPRSSERGRARTSIWLVAALAVLDTLAGTSAMARQRVTMWFWGATPRYRATLERNLVAPFNASQNRYTLRIEYRASVDSDVRIALLAGGGPDLIYSSGPGDLVPLSRAGKLAPLEAYDRQYGWSRRLLGPLVSPCRQFGHLICVPMSMQADGMFYSQAVLHRFGWAVPTDVATLENRMRQAMDAGLYASATGNMGWQPINIDYASLFLNEWAGPGCIRGILTHAKRWTDPGFRVAIEQLDRWFSQGFLGGQDYFSLNFDKALLLLSQGRTPFVFAPTILFQWAGSYFPGPAAEDLRFAPFPRPTPTSAYPIYDVGLSFTYGINARSPVKDAAAQVLDRMISPAFIRQMARVWPGYWGPPLVDFPSDPEAVGLTRSYLEAMTAISLAVRSGHYGYGIDSFFPPATRQVFIRDLEALWVGEESPKQLLSKAEETFAGETRVGTGIQPPAQGSPCAQTN